MCAHQFTRPAVVFSSSLNPSRNVTISVAMNSAMTTDSRETDAPSPTGRATTRRIEQNDDAGEDRCGERHERGAVHAERAGLREVDDPRPYRNSTAV